MLGIPLFSVINLNYNSKYVCIQKLYARKMFLIPMCEPALEPAEVSMHAQLNGALQMRAHELLSQQNIMRPYANRKCKYKIVQLQIFFWNIS